MLKYKVKCELLCVYADLLYLFYAHHVCNVLVVSRRVLAIF